MIGDAPKPKDPEIIAGEKVVEEMREIAKQLPRPENIEEKEEVIPFGDHFFYIFYEKKFLSDPFIRKKYLEKAEKQYGDKWEQFLKDNDSLIVEIRKVLENLDKYSELFRRFIILFQNPKTSELAIQAREEVKLNATYVFLWRKLNPLLEQASKIMTSDGMKPEDFYS